VGVIYDALRDECFTAEKGRGAFLNGRRLRVSSTKTLEESLLCTGFAYAVRETHYNLDNFRQFVLRAQGVRRDGSAAMNLAYVAAGRFDGFWERGIQAWDMAAGVLMVQEAGGKVTDISGKAFDLMAENALASNGKTHGAIFKILKNGRDEKSWAAKWAKRPRPR
jgi:myo-inositol-1(or 4)-monophosphatase